MSVARYKSSLDLLEYHKETLGCLKAHSTNNIEKDCTANREFVLPLYSKSLRRNTSQEEKSLTWKAFMLAKVSLKFLQNTTGPYSYCVVVSLVIKQKLPLLHLI